MISAAVHGAFLMEGMRDTPHLYGDLLEAWDKGAFELVTEVCLIVPTIEAWLKLVDQQQIDHQGVFDYEVTSAYGMWFSNVVFNSGLAPNFGTCKDKLRELFLAYFFDGARNNFAQRLV